METPEPPLLQDGESAAFRHLVGGASATTSHEFFRKLAEGLSAAIGTMGAWVASYRRETRELHAIAMKMGGEWWDGLVYPVQGTPCETAIDSRTQVHIPERIVEFYPGHRLLGKLQAVSYLGVPLFDVDGSIIGHIAVLHDEPLRESRSVRLFRLFAARAGAELRRMKAEARIRVLEEDTEALSEELDRVRGFEAITGNSPALLRALGEVAKVAPMNTTVLLLGETGTGKELFARAVHEAGPRAGRPLITVNCAAIPKDLIESELFGHEKGSFTGAFAKRDGRFTLAHQGTLFLDELGEMPHPLQAKLLRVLQEGEVQPVGSGRVHKVDVRVVAATNRDLADLVERGLFRQDLYYRLNVFPIRIPPLRERGSDIILLAERFMEAFARRLGRGPMRIDQVSRARLLAYPWPGNVRELQNVIERAMITAMDGRLYIDRGWLSESRTPPVPALASDAILTVTEMAGLERRNILRALHRAGWKVSGEGGAASLLGMKGSTLASRMLALGIRREDRARKENAGSAA